MNFRKMLAVEDEKIVGYSAGFALYCKAMGWSIVGYYDGSQTMCYEVVDKAVDKRGRKHVDYVDRF